jgi:hypothetical protein
MTQLPACFGLVRQDELVGIRNLKLSRGLVVHCTEDRYQGAMTIRKNPQLPLT